MKIVGLDLSLQQPGFARTDGSTFAVKTRDKDGDRRLLVIRNAVREAITDADLAVLEDIPRNSFAAKPLSMVHGVVRTALMDAGVSYALVTAATLKTYATGKGSGDKGPMALAAYKRAGIEFSTSDECDAWWLRHAGLDWYGEAEFPMPKVQREALTKAVWPR